MADDLTPASVSAPAASAEPAAASPIPDSSGESDTRAIAASVFADAPGETPADPPPATPSTPPTPPAAATSDGVDDADYQALLASGSMPVDRHKAVLTNARNKTRAEVEREYQAKYGWAETFDRQRAEHGLGILNGLDKAPEQTLRTLAQLLGVDLAPPAAKEPDGPPLPDVKLDDGSEFYSAKQLAKLNEWKDAQYDKKLAALEARYQPLIADRHLSQLRETAVTEAGTTLAECRASWPQFVAIEGEIKARMTANPKLSLEHAYIQAFAAKGLPALEQQYQTDRASQLTRKAAASSAPPGAARPVTPLKSHERSTRELAEMVFAQG
jgi:hypothetical protein